MTKTSSFAARFLVLGFGISLAFGTVACSKAPQPQPAATTTTPPSPSSPSAASPSEQLSSEDQIVLATSKAIRQAHLTDLKDECLTYNFEPNAFADAYLVEVRENHRHPSCGGDPQTQPKLFSVKIEKASEKMSTDKGSPGQFHSL